VHKETVTVAVAETSGPPSLVGTVRNDREEIRRLIHRLAQGAQLVSIYEAGPTGYELHRQLVGLGVSSQVAAPTLTPARPGDRVKTDQRDALALARLLRSGDLTPVWIPDLEHEALRDLVRACEDAKVDLLRARHRLTKFLLRHGISPRATSGQTPRATTGGSTLSASNHSPGNWHSKTTSAPFEQLKTAGAVCTPRSSSAQNRVPFCHLWRPSSAYAAWLSIPPPPSLRRPVTSLAFPPPASSWLHRTDSK